LVRPQPFLLPLSHHWQRPYYGAGVLAYDLFAAASQYGRGLPRHRHLSRRALLAQFPGLRRDAAVGAIRYHDAQGDDARFAVALRVRASKGVHLLVPRHRIDGDGGLILRTETSVLFVIPWGRHWIIGTTDTSWDLDRAHPAASSQDIDYLLAQVNAVLARPL